MSAPEPPSSPGTSGPSEDDPEESWVGRTLGDRFELTDVLGEGGMATVYRGEELELGRQVAVKVLKSMTARDEELRGRFEREARVLAALSHPNIVSLIDFGVAEGRPYLVMERLVGKTLGDLIDEEERLPPARALAILRQILRALAHAHSEGLLHRDLKPDNVFLQELSDSDDHVRLLDFGFAKFVSGSVQAGPELTRAGRVFGTPRYMAPEQLAGGAADVRVDLYSAAVIFYEMLSGRRPFEGEIRDVLRAKVVEDPPALSDVAADLQVCPELDAFFARALAIRRRERFEDAAAFLAALDALPDPCVRPRSAPEAPTDEAQRSGRLDRRLPWALAGGGLLAAALLAGVLWAVGRGGGEEGSPSVAAEPSRSSSARAAAASVADELPEDESVLAVADPWAAPGPLAEPLRLGREAVLSDQRVDGATLRSLRSFARGHPDDPRPLLLLGHVYAARGMQTMAVTSYHRAFEIDAGARGDPRMLVNLVRLASEADSNGRAERLIRRIYGAEAAGVLDRAIANPNLSPAAASRLRRLRDGL